MSAEPGQQGQLERPDDAPVPLGDEQAVPRIGLDLLERRQVGVVDRPLDARQLTEFMADIWREYLGTANAELIGCVRGLRPRYRTGILSNSFVGAREREQGAYGFEDLVDEIIYSHECGMSKPDPAIYALACARLAVEPARLVFVDDYEPYVEGARRAGIRAVLYRDNAQVIADIEQLLAG